MRAMKDDKLEGTDKHCFKEPKGAWKKGKQSKVVMRVDYERETAKKVKKPDERQARLLGIKASIRDTTMVAVVDSGFSRNVISTYMAEATGLPVVPLQEKGFPVTGVAGPSIQCNYMIPNAMIHVTESKLLTQGDLFVIDNIKVDLLYKCP